jgi:MFS family permease
VASLTLTATIAMMVSGPLSDRIGRRAVLKIAAALFTVSAIASAIAPDFITLVAARMLGGFGVGAALIIAPMYIAELAPADIRGRMVSFNQLNIVIGISAAFFSNYLILGLAHSELAWAQALGLDTWTWRWMLGVEALPAVFYFFALYTVPESPRWLIMHGKDAAALDIMAQVSGRGEAEAELAGVRQALDAEARQSQAALVGLVNLVFTVLAILLIDRLGRRPLLGFGLAGIAACMLLLAWGFGVASYSLDSAALASLPAAIDPALLQSLVGQTFDSDVAFREAVIAAAGAELYANHQSALVAAAIDMNPTLVLVGILGFVASFAISLGPVMWVLFSELFPNRVRGLAVSFVGLINSAVSFGVQLVFPWELQNFGNSLTFLFYGLFAILGLFIVMRLLPETKGRSLEELERELVRH